MRIKAPAKKLARRVLGHDVTTVRQFLANEARSPLRFSDPALVLTGFYSSRRWFYPERPSAAKGYVSDVAYMEQASNLNPQHVQREFSDKLAFAHKLEANGYGHRVPRMLGVSRNGRFEPMADPTGEQIIIKPVDGRAGQGVALFDALDAAVAACPPDGTYLVQERVRAHAYGLEIFPGSLNALRVQVVRSAPGARPRVAVTVNRFGRRATAPGHAMSLGGLVARVDPTGTLSYAVGALKDRHQVRHDRHPETGAQITGRTVPHYEDALALAVELMDLYPEATYVGWDVAIAEDGPVVLEGNATWPNLSILQAHGAFIADTEVRGFCVERGLLPRG